MAESFYLVIMSLVCLLSVDLWSVGCVTECQNIEHVSLFVVGTWYCCVMAWLLCKKLCCFVNIEQYSVVLLAYPKKVRMFMLIVYPMGIIF